jgi:G3E family GTPase
MTKTNLITGFLGSGKTTSILHLLANKDPAEKWAVLVNEFGEVGIDGALLADSGALIKEIPGGCMLCEWFTYAGWAEHPAAPGQA